MRPYHGAIIEVPNSPVLDVDVGAMFSNLVNTYVWTNHKASRLAALNVTSVTSLLAEALRDPDRFGHDILGLAIDDMLDVKNLMRLTNEPGVREYIGALFRARKYVADVGQCHATMLEETDFWSKGYVAMPAGGYPRPYLDFSPTLDMIGQDGSAALLPRPGCPWTTAVAVTLLVLDRSRITHQLIPEFGDNVEGRHPRSKPFGTLMQWQKQLSRIQAFAALYLVQGTLLYAHSHRRLLERALELAYAVDESSRPHIEVFKRIFESVLNIPMHPLVQYIASGLSTGSIRTAFGDDLELLYRMAPTEIRSGGDFTGDYVCDRDDSEFRTLARVAAEREAFGTAYYNKSASADQVNFSCPSKNWARLSEDAGPLTYGEFAAVIESIKTLTDQWDDVKSSLGWPSTTAEVGKISAYGGDFILCDGSSYSDSPAAGLLGLRPVISAGNIKTAGLGLTIEQEFNTKGPLDSRDRIRFSIMVAEGNQNVASTAGRHFERLYMPVGMWMGEEDVRPLHPNGALDDPLGRDVLRYYKDRAQRYVIQYYTDTNIAEGDMPDGARQTDWDAEVYAEEAATVASRWVTMMDDQMRPADEMVYLTRVGGSKFPLRFPVRMTRPSYYTMYDSLGIRIHVKPFMGQVLYDGDLSALTVSLAELDKITALEPDVPSVDPLFDQETKGEVTVTGAVTT